MFIRFIQQYFNYTKKEALGFIIISSIMLLVLIFPFFLSFFIPSQATVSKKDVKMLDSLVAKLEEQPSNKKLFEFNPNTLNKDSLLLLGLSPVVVENILKYRNAGGSFNYKRDFKKIYGLKDETYQSLAPYVILTENNETTNDQNYIEKNDFAEQIDKLDLNLANTEKLQEIKGIGEVYSERIVKYRYILGGFVKKSQLAEVYGISDFALENLMVYGEIKEGFIPEKIKINKLKEYELQYHPYVSEEIAGKIINTRKKGIHLKSRQDLKEFINIDDSVLVKLLPYIEFE